MSPYERKDPGASFGARKTGRSSGQLDGVHSDDRVPAKRYETVSDSIINDLLRSVATDNTEHVRLARTRHTRREEETFLSGDGLLGDSLQAMTTPEPGQRKAFPNLIRRKFRNNPWSLTPFALLALLVVSGLLMISNQGLKIKRAALQDGEAAVGHLAEARDAVERFSFTEASDGFSRAYEQFGRARDDLGIFNTRLGQLLAALPGGGRIESAHHLIQAGEFLSLAGGSLSELVSALAESGAILDPANDGRSSFATVLLPMQQSLNEAAEYLEQAQQLLEGIDETHVPEEMLGEFEELQKKLPEFSDLVTRGVAYVTFLEEAIAGSGEQTYLLLFQNTTELRPTGGFPGSYGIAVFSNGRLESFEADDVYNPDGQITDLIVPPLALQHITPGWGLRDSTWFADFPTSARKAIEMYARGSGRHVDGVLAVTPEVVEDLLEISGPVSLPQYDLVLSVDDFLPKLQAEVEYGIDKLENKPKKIIMELAPIILRKLYQAPRGEWLKVLSVFSEGLKERDIMMYFSDGHLQRFVADEGFDGRIRQTDGDYLMVNVANIAGGKADAVTETALQLDTELTDQGVRHELQITRRHDGGNSDFGFYNMPNRSYVRILVPQGSRLDHISGNDRRGFRPIVSYVDAEYDPDLQALEGNSQYDEIRDVTTYDESGKTAFGFWMYVEPGEVREVRISWEIPAFAIGREYELYVQRQPGLDVTEFVWELLPTKSVNIAASQPALMRRESVWQLHSGLDVDLPLSVSFE